MNQAISEQSLQTESSPGLKKYKIGLVEEFPNYNRKTRGLIQSLL